MAAAFRGQSLVPTPFLLRFSDRHYYGVIVGDFSLLDRLRFPVH
jgi:hypothetical protein